MFPRPPYRGFQQRQVSNANQDFSRRGCAVAAAGECSLGRTMLNILRRVCRISLVQHSVSVKGYGNVAFSDIPHARGGVLLVRLHGHDLVVVQCRHGLVGRSLYSSSYLGLSWLWDVVLVAGRKRYP